MGPKYSNLRACACVQSVESLNVIKKVRVPIINRGRASAKYSKLFTKAVCLVSFCALIFLHDTYSFGWLLQLICGDLVTLLESENVYFEYE